MQQTFVATNNTTVVESSTLVNTNTLSSTKNYTSNATESLLRDEDQTLDIDTNPLTCYPFACNQEKLQKEWNEAMHVDDNSDADDIVEFTSILNGQQEFYSPSKLTMILDQENSFFQSTETFEETIEQQIDTQLPSPATFFKRKSCRLGTLDSRSTETSHLERPLFQTPKKDKSGKILPDMIDLTPFVQSTHTPKQVRTPLYKSGSIKPPLYPKKAVLHTLNLSAPSTIQFTENIFPPLTNISNSSTLSKLRHLQQHEEDDILISDDLKQAPTEHYSPQQETQDNDDVFTSSTDNTPSLNFGNVKTRKKIVDIRICNPNPTKPLQILECKIISPSNAFILPSTNGFMIEADSFVALPIAFLPKEKGEYNGVLSVYYDGGVDEVKLTGCRI